jgi:methionyl-tRNA formyltransferase
MQAERLTITVVAEQGSWQVPHAARLVEELSTGHEARLVASYDAIEPSELTFFLGCTRIAGPEILARSRHNLVVHQSDLPRGRGWSPLAWQVLEGRNDIPVCLFEAVVGLDEGPIYARETIRLEGHELVSELRALQAQSAHRLIVAFVERYPDVDATPQSGEPTYYPRRTPADMRLDPDSRLVDLFPLLRIADNERYPAFFDHLGHRYVLRIEKAEPT